MWQNFSSHQLLTLGRISLLFCPTFYGSFVDFVSPWQCLSNSSRCKQSFSLFLTCTKQSHNWRCWDRCSILWHLLWPDPKLWTTSESFVTTLPIPSPSTRLSSIWRWKTSTAFFDFTINTAGTFHQFVDVGGIETSHHDSFLLFSKDQIDPANTAWRTWPTRCQCATADQFPTGKRSESALDRIGLITGLQVKVDTSIFIAALQSQLHKWQRMMYRCMFRSWLAN